MKKTVNNIGLNITFNILLVATILSRILLPEYRHQTHFSVAYLDPGTGTMIISAIVGVFATIILGVKTFWYKIAAIFKPKKKN